MDESRLWDAINSLHEQAHGRAALRTCTMEPCRTVTHEGAYAYLDPMVPEGPAPFEYMNVQDVH